MEKDIKARLYVGDLRHIGTYWFQLQPGEEAIFQLLPYTNRVVFKLVDMEKGKKSQMDVKVQDGKDLLLSFSGTGGIA